MPEEQQRRVANDRPALAVRIRMLRGRLDLNQTDFGNRYGVNQVTVSRWEKGVQMPDREHLDKLREDGLEESATGDEGSYQMNLPFERTFLVELRIGPQRADAVAVKLRLKELTN